MYEATIYGKKVQINENAYLNILDRFDVKNANRNGKIFVSCFLCLRYYYQDHENNCHKCPFDQFRTHKNTGCIAVIRKLFRDCGLKMLFSCGMHKVYAETASQRGRVMIVRAAFKEAFKKV